MKKVSHFYLGFVFLILYLPIFYLIFYAFNKGGDMNAFTGFTLEHFNELFADSRLMPVSYTHLDVYKRQLCKCRHHYPPSQPDPIQEPG